MVYNFYNHNLIFLFEFFVARPLLLFLSAEKGRAGSGSTRLRARLPLCVSMARPQKISRVTVSRSGLAEKERIVLSIEDKRGLHLLASCLPQQTQIDGSQPQIQRLGFLFDSEGWFSEVERCEQKQDNWVSPHLL